jgi:hypothetical protein
MRVDIHIPGSPETPGNPQEQMLTSRGEKDGGIITSDPLARF